MLNVIVPTLVGDIGSESLGMTVETTAGQITPFKEPSKLSSGTKIDDESFLSHETRNTDKSK